MSAGPGSTADSSPALGRIAYLTGEYPRATDTFIQREVAALRSSGIEVSTCSIRRTGVEHLVGPEQRAEARDTFYVIAAATSPWRLVRSHGAAFARSPRGYLDALRLAWRTSSPGLKARLFQLFYFVEAGVLADHLRRTGVVHLHNHIATAACTVTMLASALGGFSYSFTIHGPDIFFEPRRWRIDEKIARAAFVACISDFCRSQAMIFSAREHWDRLHIVHCGVDPARYADAGDARSDDGERILFVGRLAAVKGVPVLFEALSRLRERFPRLRAVLIGDGPERATLEAEARSRGLGEMVEFAGYKSQSEVADALRATDVLVLPSFAEGVPVTLMEAMAARRPVLATRIAGIPELVTDGVSGALVPPGDPVALAERLAELLSDPDGRARMGDAGRARVVAEFNLELEASWLAALFRAYVLRQPRPGKRPTPGGNS